MSAEGEVMRTALAAWGNVEVLEPFASGSMNDVWAVNVNGQHRVARQSTRNGADLDWELDLLLYLHESGLPVPQLVPTVGGRLRVGNIILMEAVAGRPAQSDEDYALVSGYLHRLHELTADRPTQRPGWRACVELGDRDVSGPVDIRHLPHTVATRCRRAWARLDGLSRSVVHGDPNPSNVRVTPDDEVVLLDWDEARVDSSCLDLARPPMPQPLSGLDEATFELALHAFRAWEAALFWHAAPDHARKQLARIP